MSDLRGKWVLLDFWATWCGPCIAELPFLREAYDAYKGRPDFAMLGMSLDDDWETIERFMQREPMPWRHCRLGSFGTSSVLRAYGVHGIPESFLISPQGIVLARGLAHHPGASSGSGAGTGSPGSVFAGLRRDKALAIPAIGSSTVVCGYGEPLCRWSARAARPSTVLVAGVCGAVRSRAPRRCV